MKLSQYLTDNPELDVDIGDEPGRIFLDAVYLFRVISAGGDPGSSHLYYRTPINTDGIIYRGMLHTAIQYAEGETYAQYFGK